MAIEEINLRFTSVDHDEGGGSTAISENEEGGIPEENTANFAKRDVLMRNESFPGSKIIGI